MIITKHNHQVSILLILGFNRDAGSPSKYLHKVKESFSKKQTGNNKKTRGAARNNKTDVIKFVKGEPLTTVPRDIIEAKAAAEYDYKMLSEHTIDSKVGNSCHSALCH